jgi:hypothetical protein
MAIRIPPRGRRHGGRLRGNGEICGIYQPQPDASRLHGQLFGFLRKDIFELDTEGYDIGGLASLILRFQFPERSWWKEVAQGLTPVQILLDKMPPVEEAVDPEVGVAYHGFHAKMQKHADKLLGETLRLQGMESSVYLSFPFDWQTGSFSPIAFYVMPEAGMALTPMGEPMVFASEDFTSKITIKPKGVTTNDIPNNPCNSVWNIVVPAEAVLAQGDFYEIKASKVEGSFRAERKKSSAGKNWLCGK